MASKGGDEYTLFDFNDKTIYTLSDCTEEELKEFKQESMNRPPTSKEIQILQELQSQVVFSPPSSYF